MSRRRFLSALAGVPIAMALPGYLSRASQISSAHQQKQQLTFFSAQVNSQQHYSLTAFNEVGQRQFDCRLPERGHGICVRSPCGPNQRSEHELVCRDVVVVARRPGHNLWVIDRDSGALKQQLDASTNRHFLGHGVTSHNGRWLYTSENDFDNGRGVIGVRDITQNYRQVAEWPSYGIGPHELALSSDGRQLIVANGGRQTHPDSGRAILNSDTMQSTLTYIDTQNGQLIEQLSLPAEMQQTSLRHLAVGRDDLVCFAMQHGGHKSDRPPLLGFHQPGQALQCVKAPDHIQQQMKNYCGSVCADSSQAWFAVSSPRGNLITFWDAKTRGYQHAVEVLDGCGVARSQRPGEFILSSGAGKMWRYRPTDQRRIDISLASEMPEYWDNHMASG